MKHHLFRLFGAVGLAATVSAPLAAETVSQCQERVIANCADAMEDANVFERVALGVFCSGLLAGCSVRSVNVSLPAPT